MKPMSDMLLGYIAQSFLKNEPPASLTIKPFVTASCRLGFHDRCTAVRVASTGGVACACRCHGV
jgi:hypothetical protein